MDVYLARDAAVIAIEDVQPKQTFQVEGAVFLCLADGRFLNLSSCEEEGFAGGTLVKFVDMHAVAPKEWIKRPAGFSG